MKTITYKTNEQLWSIENAATAAGYQKTNDCYWAQIFRNAETGHEFSTSREENSSNDPAADFAEMLNAINETPDAVNIDDLKNDLNTGDYGDSLNDYRDSSTYICDAITEIADNHTSIYYSDILDFIRKNPESLADAVNEGLYDPMQDYDLYKHGQAAEYMVIEYDVYDHLADSLMLAALDFIKYDLKRETIPAELADLIREWCDDADNNDSMDEIPDRIREYFAEKEEEEPNLYDMTPEQAWAAWKAQKLTVGQMTDWQQNAGIYFNEKGEIINEQL